MVRGRVGHSAAFAPAVKAKDTMATSALTDFHIFPPNFFLIFASDE
jgi:hypothetical protein